MLYGVNTITDTIRERQVQTETLQRQLAERDAEASRYRCEAEEAKRALANEKQINSETIAKLRDALAESAVAAGANEVQLL